MDGQVGEYLIEVGLGPYNVGWATSVNLDTWNNLPPNIQKIFEDTIDETIPFMFELQRENDAEQIKAFREASVIVYTLAPAELQKIKALAPLMIDSWVNLKPEESAARRQFIQDYIDLSTKVTVPPGWEYDPRPLFK